MKHLDVNYINIFSEYKVWAEDDDYFFVTDYDIKYLVSFDKEDTPRYNAYWFNLSNMNHQASPRDTKVAQTVICVIEEFFRQNPDILLYICSTDKGQQAQRARLFLSWFNRADQQKRFIIKTAEMKGEEPKTKEYVAIIIPRIHPKADEALAWFDEETTMFNAMKP